MIKYLTESATAILVGIEAFMLGFGAIWMVLNALLTVHGWLIPALTAGAVAALIATLSMLRLARASALNERKLVDAATSDQA